MERAATVFLPFQARPERLGTPAGQPADPANEPNNEPNAGLQPQENTPPPTPPARKSQTQTNPTAMADNKEPDSTHE